MKAMVLAAGVGSRLRPLTDRMPKALVPVAGVPLVEHVLRRLRAAGVRDVIVNTHHRAAELEGYLRGRADEDGLRIEIAHEPELLDTGGGLKNVAWFFAGEQPFFVHNADILSGVDLRALYAAHASRNALATLSVRARESARHFLFDAGDRLVGWERSDPPERDWAAAPVAGATALAFDGIQVVSPAVFAKLSESGCFSLTRAYLRLAGCGERIAAYRSDGTYWADIGSHAKLEAVERHVLQHGLPR
jgi:NDP-sugar pyrophosphorylase family protein